MFSPVCHCATDKAEISFKLRHRRLGHGDDRRLRRATWSPRSPTDGRQPTKASSTFSWNGRTSAGTSRPNGSVYRPQVHARERPAHDPHAEQDHARHGRAEGRSRRAPATGILIAGGHHGIAIQYVLGERAHASVYVGGRRCPRSPDKRRRGEVKWNGKVGGKALPPGRYVLEVAAVDIAGNETPPAERKRVVVRIRADRARRDAEPRRARRALHRQGPDRGAPQYTWRFAGEHGTGTKKLLHLRAPSHRGRYRLVVSRARPFDDRARDRGRRSDRPRAPRRADRVRRPRDPAAGPDAREPDRGARLRRRRHRAARRVAAVPSALELALAIVGLPWLALGARLALPPRAVARRVSRARDASRSASTSSTTSCSCRSTSSRRAPPSTCCESSGAETCVRVSSGARRSRSRSTSSGSASR